MLHRIGISINEVDFKELKALQKRFKLSSRSEVIRELVQRFREQEKKQQMINQLIESYRRHPETPEEIKENEEFLKATLKDLPDENW